MGGLWHGLVYIARFLLVIFGILLTILLLYLYIGNNYYDGRLQLQIIGWGIKYINERFKLHLGETLFLICLRLPILLAFCFLFIFNSFSELSNTFNCYMPFNY